MKKLLFLLFFIPLVSFGQTKDEIELCASLQANSFTTDKEAENALNRILSIIGASSKNFVLAPCDKIDNAVATSFKGTRYIFYDKDFMKLINQNTNDWSNLLILAHEVGHHIRGHSIDILLYSSDIVDEPTLQKSREMELEADEFAGFILAKLGANYNQISETIKLISTNKEDIYSTHPNKTKRLEAIKKGFDNGYITSKKSTKSKDYDNNLPKSNFSSNWKYWTETNNEYIKKFGKENEDPFIRKKNNDRIPIITKNVTANGKSLDGETELVLNIRFQKWPNIYGILPGRNGKLYTEDSTLSPIDPYFEDIGMVHGAPTAPTEYLDQITLQDEKDLKRKWLPYQNIEIWFVGFQDQPNIVLFHNSFVDKFPEYNLVSSKSIFTKLNYMIDDSFTGYAWVELKGWTSDNVRRSKSNGVWVENKNYGKPLKWTFLPLSFIWHQNDKEYENLIGFINAIKKGKTLYFKLDNYAAVGSDNYKSGNFQYNNKINSRTYVFDLTGSAKALDF